MKKIETIGPVTLKPDWALAKIQDVLEGVSMYDFVPVRLNQFV
jgi:hypothetical protein